MRDCFSQDQDTVAMTLGHQALVLQGWGQLDEALVLYKKQEVICEELGDRAGLSSNYGNQAILLKRLGQMDEALVLYKRNEEICENFGDRANLSITYWNQGCVYEKLNNPKMQKQLWVKSIAIRKAMGIPTEDLEKTLAELEKSLE